MDEASIRDPAPAETNLLDPAQPGDLRKAGIIDFGSPEADEIHGLKVVCGYKAEQPPRSRVRGLRQQAPGGRSAEAAIDEAAGAPNRSDGAALGVNTIEPPSQGDGRHGHQRHRQPERDAEATPRAGCGQFCVLVGVHGIVSGTAGLTCGS